jgi:hypothetical protein
LVNRRHVIGFHVELSKEREAVEPNGAVLVAFNELEIDLRKVSEFVLDLD